MRARLVAASALMLFLELALIRWLGANIVHLAYFSDFVLLGSFLGVGLGLLRAAAPDHPSRPRPVYSLLALVALVGFVSAYPVTIDRAGSDLLFFTSLSTSGPPLPVVLPAVFLAVAAVMAGPGELVGAGFRALPRLDAYRCDLLGSLAGIAAFTALSYLDSPPLVWFGIVALASVALLGRAATAVTATVLVAVVALFGYPLAHDHGVFWSPYYEVSTQAGPDGNGGTQWNVSVNGIPHQRLTSVATRAAQEPWYFEPYRDVPTLPRNVLIVGAGTGTDVAIALHEGARHVDAVEIDPTLLRFGREHDPDQAYQDPRVSAYVDDGRAWLQQTGRHYDLILFALPDSLTLVQGASSLRLESYLFTEQAVAVARAHLTAHGAFAMYNFYRQQWLVDRLAGTLDDVFGHSPCLYEQPAAGALAVLTVGRTVAGQRCARTWTRTADTPAPATDDYPFVYLEHRGIPGLYLRTLALILLGSAAAIVLVLAANGRWRRRRLAGQLRGMWGYRDLFLLGASFLLLETKYVTGFALLFGTTWLVNALVFTGVLAAVLAGVELTHRRPTPPLPVLYAALAGTLALNWWLPTGWLLGLPLLVRAAVAVTVAALPVLTANVIFAKRFAGTADAPLALGTNLLGAILGGCLEYLCLVVGNRALLLVAGALYALAFVLMPRSRARGAAVPRVSEMSLQPL
ncbi:MAG TPA: hypothetical protein VFL65_12620 [Jatrophihabitans sp.]|nr:hypothetical protein [Jatrophihabitans sp.]